MPYAVKVFPSSAVEENKPLDEYLILFVAAIPIGNANASTLFSKIVKSSNNEHTMPPCDLTNIVFPMRSSSFNVLVIFSFKDLATMPNNAYDVTTTSLGRCCIRMNGVERSGLLVYVVQRESEVE